MSKIRLLESPDHVLGDVTLIEVPGLNLPDIVEYGGRSFVPLVGAAFDASKLAGIYRPATRWIVEALDAPAPTSPVA